LVIATKEFCNSKAVETRELHIVSWSASASWDSPDAFFMSRLALLVQGGYGAV